MSSEGPQLTYNNVRARLTRECEDLETNNREMKHGPLKQVMMLLHTLISFQWLLFQHLGRDDTKVTPHTHIHTHTHTHLSHRHTTHLTNCYTNTPSLKTHPLTHYTHHTHHHTPFNSSSPGRNDFKLVTLFGFCLDAPGECGGVVPRLEDCGIITMGFVRET